MSALLKRSLLYISRENCRNFIKICWLLFLFQPTYQNSKCIPMCVRMDVIGKPRNKVCFHFLISFISFLNIYLLDIFWKYAFSEFPCIYIQESVKSSVFYFTLILFIATCRNSLPSSLWNHCAQRVNPHSNHMVIKFHPGS